MHEAIDDDDLPETAQAAPLRAIVPHDAGGKRFDLALAELFPDYSRSRLAEWIKSGDALLDGERRRPRDPVRGGESVTLTAVTGVETGAQAEEIPLTIAFEDADVLVIDKPAGLVVHPGAGNPRGTLVNALLHFDPKLAEMPRAGIVHRLDKDTSGLMVVARNLRAHAALVEQLSARDVQRQYLAVVMGPMIAGGTVDAPIGRHPTDRVRMAVVKNGRDAVTHYRVRERFRAHTLVECRLETGRTHQIRVHMAHIKHPIVGDPVYSRLANPRGASAELVQVLREFRRQALHAEKLSFAHPVGGETVSVETAMPADLQALVAALCEDARHAEGRAR
jgi:23S rRNA pseudouridine1911/1915/1917 synthase